MAPKKTADEGKPADQMQAMVRLLDCFDLDDLIMSATSYYLGRSTINVSAFCDSLVRAWPNLGHGTQGYIQRVVEEAFRRDDIARDGDWSGPLPLGHDTDRAEWRKVRQCWSV